MALLKKQGCTKELQARIAPEPVEASEDRWLRAGRGSCGVHTTRRGSRAGARSQQLLTDTETMSASLRDRVNNGHPAEPWLRARGTRERVPPLFFFHTTG